MVRNKIKESIIIKCHHRAPFPITQIPPPGGDGGSNLMTVCGGEVCIRYAHANDGFIDRRLKVGASIALGQQLALTGGTWQGRSGISDPHLHMAAFVLMDGQEVPVNCYSRYVEAYQARYPKEILPVAGGYRFSRVGQRIELDASRSILPADCTSPRYTWTLSDGTKQEGAQISFQIDQAGNYTQMLSISDHQGRIAHDSVMVYVSDGQCQKLPFSTINHYPVRGLRAGEEVALLIHVSDMENVQVDFGDGLRVNWQQELRHVYHQPGDYVVTVTEQGPAAQGYFCAVVRVEG